MRLVTTGRTRTVLLVGGLAVKIPGRWLGSPREWWGCLLRGLLANMQEVEFSKTGWPELCPVRFSLPGGLLVVMVRARPITDHQLSYLRPEDLIRRPGYEIPAEWKAESFGWVGGNIVAIDYGGGGRGGRARRPYLTGDD